MSHTVTVGYRSQTIELGWRLGEYGNDSFRLGMAPQYSGTMFQARNPMLYYLAGTLIQHQARPINYWVGRGFVGDEPYQFTVPGQRPVNFPYDPHQDRRLFSGYFSGLQSALHLQQVHATKGEENGVFHEQVHGSSQIGNAATQLPGFLYGSDLFERLGVEVLPLQEGRGYHTVDFDDVLGSYIRLSTKSNHSTWFTFSECVDKLQQYIDANGGWSMAYVWWQQWTIGTITRAEWYRDRTSTSDSVHLSYDGHLKRYAFNAYPNTEQFVRIPFSGELTFTATPVQGKNPTGTWWKWAYCDLQTISKLTPLGVEIVWPPEYGDSYDLQKWGREIAGAGKLEYESTYPWDAPFSSGVGPMFCSDVNESISVDEGLSAVYKRKARALKPHVDSELERLTPLAFYSTADALSKYTDIVSANWLETFSDAKDISSFLPSIGSLMKLIRALRRRDLRGTIREGLDTATGTYLWYQFAGRPLNKDVREAVDSYDRMVERLRLEGVWGPKTLYGEFHWDHPDGYPGSPQVHFESHTKTRLVFEDFAFLTLLFSSSAVGLAPTLENMWEVVPFSFVLDWFTNVGARLGDVDKQATLLMLPHQYSVHSIKASTDYPGVIPGVDVQTSDDSKSSVYYRWLSFTHPSLRWSGYDFRPPSGISGKLKTVGSLAWQVLS